MSLVCIFHDRAELRYAEGVSAILTASGYTTWVANRDSHADWRTEVEEILARPDCLGSIVIWSIAAVANPIVVDEADATLRAGRKLLGLLLDNARPPLGFGNTPRIVLPHWDGSPNDERAANVLTTKLERMARGSGASRVRIDEITFEGRTLRRPAFVFSVSSFETQISPAKTLELLNLFAPPAVLVSAYDVLGARDASADVMPSPKVLRDLETSDTVIFLDSGNYEAYRLDDAFWQRSPWVLQEATNRLRCDVIFSHDRLIEVEHVHQHNPEELARGLFEDLERDALATGRKTISPIVHAPRLRDGRFAAELLPELCTLVAKKRRPPVVAVAERELGDGILERARRVRSIRVALDRLGFKQPLHLLGTGNPLSMMILAFAGGDMFDGLEWCRTVVDGKTMRLHHFHHFDLFLGQRSMIQDDMLREYLTTKDELLTAKAKTVLHNLYFFKNFERELYDAHRHDSFEELFERYLPGEYGRILRRISAEEPRLKLDPFRVEAAAVDLAHTIALEGPFNAPRSVDEVMRELFLAIISSRVRWEVACAIVEDLLSIVRSSRTTGLHEAVQSAAARHRHPRQVARWVEVLLAENGRMLNRALRTAAMQEEPGLVRRHLIAEVVGLGPKQASLFLRNVGRGHRLAVLDRHVVRFMQLLGIFPTQEAVASIAGYERMEAGFVAYADRRRISADALDLAVWVVMRTATGRVVREHRNACLRQAGLHSCGCTGGGGGPDAVPLVH